MNTMILPLAEICPYSFAMAHAKDGVKQAAAYETERVETITKKADYGERKH